MVFCGKCGQMNPDGSAFCSACGEKLQAVETPVAGNAPYMNQPPRYEQQPTPPPNFGFEKPVNKGGSKGGCLKKLLIWIVVLIVVIGGVLYAIGSWSGGKDGGGGDEDKHKPAKSERVDRKESKRESGLLGKDYERSFDDKRFAELQDWHEFPSSTIDVSLQPGTYTSQIEKYGLTVTTKLKVEDANEGNKQIVGKGVLTEEVAGETETQSIVITYAGNSVYAGYTAEDKIGDLGDAFVMYVSPDGKTIDVYCFGDVLYTFTKE